jgi:sigma-E factor negative regulatory protein RseB
MARRSYSLALLTVLLAIAPALHAADREAREWLERMSRSLSTRNYEGRFFHVRNSRSETMRIIHRVDRGKVTERLVSLDGSGREIIRNQSEVICYLPDRRTVLVEKRTDDSTLLAAVPAYNDQLEAHYSIQRGPSTKALGRRTQVIMVQPRDQFRYGYRLWLDYETAMPLMSQLRDSNGVVIEQILFAELNFRDSIPPELLKPAVTGEGYRWLRQDVQQANVVQTPAGWNVIRVPAGFRRTTVRMQVIAGSNTPVLHLVYSDGLASVSVFIEPRNPQTEEMNGLAKVGAAFAYSRNLDGHQVTAVGEVPAATVEAIAAGVTKEGAATPLAREPSVPPPR